MSSKATKAVVTRRIEEVFASCWTADPLGHMRICARKRGRTGRRREVPQGGKPLSDSQIRRYVAKANDLIAASGRAHRKKLFRRHLAQRRNLYAKAVSQGDIRAALACLDSEAKLCGLFEDEIMRMIDRMEKDIAESKRS